MSYPQTDNPLWTAYEAAAATGGTLLAGDDWSASGISFDTRSLQPGDLFVAIKGERDGHEFITSAAAKGAAAALVDHVPADAPEALPLLQVTDTLKGLEALGVAARERFFGKLLAVTGSVGKTTTKEMLRSALSAAGRVHAAERSFNNHLGVPTSLATLPPSVDYGVFEIGMNHGGEITPLVGFVHPHVAIITAIAPAHLENFDSLHGIAAAKAEILTSVREGGAAVLPADSEFYDFLKSQAEEHQIKRIIPFGESDIAKEGCQLISYIPDGRGATVEARLHGQPMTFKLAAPGRHLALNALAGIAATDAIGVPLDAILTGIASFKAGEGRGETHKVAISGGEVTILDEAYNANPASMAASLAVTGMIKLGPGGRRIAFLGAMKELGCTSGALHEGLAEPLAAANVDLVLLAGEEMIPLKHALPPEMVVAWAPEAADLAEPLEKILTPGDVVLFKGSLSVGIGAVLREFLAKHARAE